MNVDVMNVNNSNKTSIRSSPFSFRTSLRSSASFSIASTSKIPQRISSSPSFTTTSSIDLISNTNPQASTFLEILSKCREGLKYHEPELCEEGVNGTYFIKDKNGRKIAVFKPQDEEASSENNPKAQLFAANEKSNLPNKGIRPGEAAVREVAAYLLDRENIFGVPKTQLVKISHQFSSSGKLIQKIGSLQEYIENDGCSEDFGYRSFPINEVHKIGILDIQILNVDRHSGNVLVKKNRNSTFSLTPIDQGFSLPDNLECYWFEWMNWNQSKIPFDDEMKSYIFRIDIEKDIQMLQKELQIRPECLKIMKITTTLLKKACELNLTLYDIGLILCRKHSSSNTSIPSSLESIYEKARIQFEYDILKKEKDLILLMKEMKDFY